MSNKHHFNFIRVLKSINISRVSKCQLYKTVIFPAVNYGAETQVINKSDEITLMTFEKGILKNYTKTLTLVSLIHSSAPNAWELYMGG